MNAQIAGVRFSDGTVQTLGPAVSIMINFNGTPSVMEIAPVPATAAP